MTEMNSLPTDEKIPVETANTRRMFWGTIALDVLALLVFGYFLVFLLNVEKTPIIYVGMVIFLSTFLAAATSAILTIRGRQKLGAEIVLYSLSVLGITMIVVFQGRTPTASLSILSISTITILYLLPKQSRRWYFSVAVASTIAMWVIEWINPSWRIQLGAAKVGPAAVIIFAVILAAMLARQAWTILSLRWKMFMMAAALFLGTLSIAIAGYSGLQSMRYQFSNIYDFMFVPITTIQGAGTTLEEAQRFLTQAASGDVTPEERTQSLAQVQADNQAVEEVINTYDTEWVTTTSPQFTQDLENGGKIGLQQQELADLAAYHKAYDAYKATLVRYLATVQAGNPDANLANAAIAQLQEALTQLQALIDVNLQFADFSNTSATVALHQALVTGVIVLIIGLVLGIFMSYLTVVSITSRLGTLTNSARSLQEGKLDQVVEVTGRDEVSVLGAAFNSMASQLKTLFSTLEQRVADRTRNLELAAEVGRSVSQVRELNVMLRDACELILKEFDLYYVQVYLTDPGQRNLILEAGTGEVGAQLLGRSHSLSLDTGSINGRAAVEKHPVVISDTAQSATFRPNSLLPETRGEMAVPLIVAEKVVGVLDMQSSHPGTLNEDVLPAFEALAGQLAVAIQNANLLKEAEQARAGVEAQARRLVRTGWGEYMDAIHKPEHIGFIFDHNQVAPLDEIEASQVSEDGQAVSTPIAITGESLGSLVVELDDKASREQTTELVNIVARQLAQQIENLRLLESADRYRFEAEQAARRQTHEGWQEYIESRKADSLGYLYDLKEVRPYSNGHEDENALTLPLKARNEKVGKLAIQGVGPDDKDSFDLANAVAERLGTHIESLRLFEETKRGQFELDKRAKQLAAVAQVSTASSQELDVQKMLETVVHLTQRQFGLYHAHVFTYHEATEELQIVACGYREGDEHEGTHGTSKIPLAQEQSLVARSARTKQAVIVNDVHNEPGWLPNPLLPETRAELAVPLLVGDELLGVLDVQSEHLDAFTEEDANIQLTLASQVAIALQNARSFAQAQKQAEREVMLNTINQKIQSATSVEAVLQIAARELGHALGAPMTIAQLSMKDQN
jgi:GAF domain-containing protein/HAMP domain-containing protein